MIISLCFWTATLRIIGPNSHWEVLFPLLCGFCSVLYLLVIAVRNRIEQKSETKEKPSPTTRSESRLWRNIRRRGEGGAIPYREVAFSAVLLTVLAVLGNRMSNPEHVTLFGLHVLTVLPPDSMKVVSPSTGPLRADICPENDLMKYQPKAGYTMCKFTYVDRGCMDIGSSKDGFIWVKNLDESTATLSDQDTFKPWPDCHVNELEASSAR